MTEINVARPVIPAIFAFHDMLSLASPLQDESLDAIRSTMALEKIPISVKQTKYFLHMIKYSVYRVKYVVPSGFT